MPFELEWYESLYVRLVGLGVFIWFVGFVILDLLHRVYYGAKRRTKAKHLDKHSTSVVG